MKKTFGILIIIYFSFFSCSKSTISPYKKNDVAEYGFNGKVKSVKSELFNLIAEKDTFRIGDKTNGISLDRNLFIEFNQVGNLVSSKEYSSNEEVIYEKTYFYDENDRLNKRKEIDNYGKGSFMDYEFDYNPQDSITKIVITEDDFRLIYKIERDNKNRPTKTEVIKNDTIIMTYKVKYDHNNNAITENEFINKDIPFKLIERTFNTHNLKEKEHVVEYKTFDTLIYENKFVYDANLNIILEKYNIKNDTTFLEIKNTYHKNGKLKESTITPKGSSYFVVTTRKFNTNGDLILHTRVPSEDNLKEVWEYIFKYDSEKNWIEKIEYKDNKPLRLVQRVIEYY